MTTPTYLAAAEPPATTEADGLEARLDVLERRVDGHFDIFQARGDDLSKHMDRFERRAGMDVGWANKLEQEIRDRLDTHDAALAELREELKQVDLRLGTHTHLFGADFVSAAKWEGDDVPTPTPDDRPDVGGE